MYDIAKSLHIIFIVSWFAGLFYMVRLFIYHYESNDKEQSEKTALQSQFKIMEKRLWYIITWPAMIGTILFGTWMLALNPILLEMDYMQIKLGFVFILILYHFICQNIYKNLQKNIFSWSSGKLRLWNELATLLLVSIVFIIVLKNSINWIYGVIGFFGIGILLMIGIKIYKNLKKD